MKFWVVLLVLTVVFLGACRSERVDIRDLTPHDRALFAEAAAIEGVDTTIHGRPGDWSVEYDFGMRDNGSSKTRATLLGLYCKIRINPNLLNNCETDNTGHHFKNVVRHELRHCEAQNGNHSSDPKSLMYPGTPCWPVD